jgi:WD40 repeat protein
LKAKSPRTASAKPKKSAGTPRAKVSPRLVAKLPGLSYSAHQIAFSPDSRFLASGGHGSGHRLWRAPDFKSHHALGTADDVVTSLAFTSESRRLAIASTGDVVSVWETATGKNICNLAIKGTCRDVAFSNDGKQLVAAVGKSVYLWDLASTRQLSKTDYKGIVETVAYHPDGRLIAKIGKLTVVTPPAGRSTGALTIDHKGSPMFVTLSPDGRTFLAVGGKHHVQLWDATTGKPGLVFGEDVEDSAYFASHSPDGKLILTSDSEGTIRLWDAATGNLRTTWSGPDDGCTVGAAFSSDGRLVAAQFDEIRLYDASAGDGDAPIATLPFLADENCFVFSPDDRFLAAGSDEAIMVWALR